VTDGQGSALANVQIRTDVATVTTDASGRYEIRSTKSSVVVRSLHPADGYEGGYSGYGPPLTPGRRDFVARRIVRVTIVSPGTIPVSDGTLWYSVNPRALYGTGEEERLSGDEFFGTCSPDTILKCRKDSGLVVIEGLAPGTGRVSVLYWGVRSAEVSVEVTPRR
jgi:hypothetical protein